MAAAAILNFEEMSMTPNWIQLFAQIWWADASRPCGNDCVTKSQNRKLIRVTSSNGCLKHMCDCKLHIFEKKLIKNTNTTLSTRQNDQIHINWKSKMAAAAILNFGKMAITPDWIKISCKKLYGKMHHGHAEMTTWPNSKPEVNSHDVIKWRSETYVRRSQWL